MQTDTLTIKRSKALSLYKSSDEKGKSLISSLIGDESIFQKITDRVKSFDDACLVLGIESEDVLPYSDPETIDELAINAFAKLSIIAKALNEGWKPNWKDSNEYKWYPYFEMSGSGFVGVICYGWHSDTDVGSRLCFKSRDLAEYAGKQFEKLYNQFFALND